MDRPAIGVMPQWDQKKSRLWIETGYMDSLAAAGALPVMLPMTDDRVLLEQAARRLGGFLFPGGQETVPALRGDPPCPIRDEMEAVLLKLALAQDKPMLGICRGMQLFNVMLGGTLYQDIRSELDGAVVHWTDAPCDRTAHEVTLVPDSPLAALLERDVIAVNSLHSQGVKALSPRLAAMAHAPDGLVEAVYAPDRRFVWGVQWHPELWTGENSGMIFGAFVEACM